MLDQGAVLSSRPKHSRLYPHITRHELSCTREPIRGAIARDILFKTTTSDIGSTIHGNYPFQHIPVSAMVLPVAVFIGAAWESPRSFVPQIPATAAVDEGCHHRRSSSTLFRRSSRHKGLG